MTAAINLKVGPEFNGVSFSECLYAGSAALRHGHQWPASDKRRKPRRGDSIALLAQALGGNTSANPTLDVLNLISDAKIDTFMERMLNLADDMAEKSGTKSDLDRGRMWIKILKDKKPETNAFGEPLRSG